MKRLCRLSLLPLLLLAGCGNQTNELKLKVVAPVGAPSVAFYGYANDKNFVTNSNVATITSYLNGTADYDVVVVDTTSGIQAINQSKSYKIAATITLGNFYIASTGKDSKSEIDIDDVVVLFGNPNAVPNKIFTYLYGSEYNVEYCGGGVDKAAQVLETGKNLATGHDADWVFIAEPYLYKAQKNETSIICGKDFPIINIQEVYKEKSGNLPLMQASVFIKNTVEKEDADEFLNKLKNDIENGISNPSLIKEGISKKGETQLVESTFGVSSDIIENVMKTNRLGLGYMSAKENKEAIDSYIALFGMEETSEEIYY